MQLKREFSKCNLDYLNFHIINNNLKCVKNTPIFVKFGMLFLLLKHIFRINFVDFVIKMSRNDSSCHWRSKGEIW